jgi:hypothetical protein
VMKNGASIEGLGLYVTFMKRRRYDRQRRDIELERTKVQFEYTDLGVLS